MLHARPPEMEPWYVTVCFMRISGISNAMFVNMGIWVVLRYESSLLSYGRAGALDFFSFFHETMTLPYFYE